MMAGLQGSWTVGPLELFVVCELLGQQRLPFPLAFGAPPATEDEFGLLRRRAAATLRERMDETFERALAAFGNPLVRMQAVGGITQAAGQNMASIRLCACLTAEDAVVAAQQPGASFSLGGEIVLSLCPRAEAGDSMVSALPPGQPGREPAMRLRPEEIAGDRPFPRWGPGTAAGRSPQPVRDLLDRPASVYCEIFVGPGANAGPAAPADGTLVAFADYPGDGRYLIERDSGVTATPVSKADLSAHITRQIAEAWPASSPA